MCFVSSVICADLFRILQFKTDLTQSIFTRKMELINKDKPQYTSGSSTLNTNGQCLSGVDIPMELLETLLGFLSIDSLLLISEVCHLWKDIIRNPVFWKQYYKSHGRNSSLWTQVHNHIAGRPDEWAVHFAVCKHDVFGRNLLTNPYGTDGFNGWKILSGDLRHAGNPPGWCIVDNPGSRIPNFPQGLGPPKCFTTDAFSCSKDQKIDLWAVGFTPAVMRAIVPFTIHWSSYVGTPLGYEGGSYELFIRLISKTSDDLNFLSLSSDSITKNQHKDMPEGYPFTKCGGSHTISGADAHEIVDKELRYIYFFHGGMAKSNERGNNGPHIYNPSVSIELPTPAFT